MPEDFDEELTFEDALEIGAGLSEDLAEDLGRFVTERVGPVLDLVVEHGGDPTAARWAIAELFRDVAAAIETPSAPGSSDNNGSA